MSSRLQKPLLHALTRAALRAVPLTTLLLLVEFFDELNFGVEGAALPAFRSDFGMNYAQAGLLLGLPAVVSTLTEPAIMLLGDTRVRKALIVGGGLAVTLSLGLVSSASSFSTLLLAMAILFPATGAFVSLSQATLMDLNLGREAQAMARWTLAGSIGVLLGPLVLAAGFAFSLGWRWAFASLAVLSLGLSVALAIRPLPAHLASNGAPPSLGGLWENLRQALRSRSILRWIVLLDFSDLMLDIFSAYLALYFVDVVGASKAQAGVALAVLMATGMLSDALLIPLLERVPGRTVVRASAIGVAGLYVLWLTLPGFAVKLGLLALIGFARLGWYAVLQGEAYATAPGRSGTVMALLAASPGAGVLAWVVGLVAHRSGLETAMWLLLAGPVALALFLPRRKNFADES